MANQIVKTGPIGKGEAPSWEQCDALAQEGMWGGGAVGEKKASACEEAYPEDFAADYIGKRAVKLWYVKYTWSKWFNSLWTNPAADLQVPTSNR